MYKLAVLFTTIKIALCPQYLIVVLLSVVPFIVIILKIEIIYTCQLSFKLGNYDGNTCCKLSWRDLRTMQNTSNGTSRTNCFNCALVWLERPARFCGTLENSPR